MNGKTARLLRKWSVANHSNLRYLKREWHRLPRAKRGEARHFLNSKLHEQMSHRFEDERLAQANLKSAP